MLCRFCGLEFEHGVPVCVHCGARVVAPRWPRRLLGIALLLIATGTVVIVVVGAQWMYGIAASRGRDKMLPADRYREVSYFSANELSREYLIDERGADRQFKNRRLGLWGSVREIGRTTESAPFIRLETSGLDIDCWFGLEHREAVEGVAPGDTVTLAGVCGGRDLGLVRLYRCEIRE